MPSSRSFRAARRAFVFSRCTQKGCSYFCSALHCFRRHSRCFNWRGVSAQWWFQQYAQLFADRAPCSVLYSRRSGTIFPRPVVGDPKAPPPTGDRTPADTHNFGYPGIGQPFPRQLPDLVQLLSDCFASTVLMKAKAVDTLRVWAVQAHLDFFFAVSYHDCFNPFYNCCTRIHQPGAGARAPTQSAAPLPRPRPQPSRPSER